MISTRNLLLFGLLGLQLGVVGWQHRPQPGASMRARASVFEDLAAAAVTGLTIEDGTKSVELRKGADGWVVASAFDHPADGEKVDRLLRELTVLEVVDVVSTSGKFQRKLEVADDDFVRKAVLVTDSGTQTVLLGTSGRGGSTHLRRGDSVDIVAVRDFGTWKLNTSVSSWLDTLFFEADQERIAELEVRRGSDTILLQRSEAGWRLGDGAANTEAVDKLLDKVERMSFRDVAGKVDSAKVATLVVTVGLRDDTPESGESPEATGEEAAEEEEEHAAEAGPKEAPSDLPLAVGERIMLHFAPEGGDDNRYLAWREDKPHVVTIGEWTIKPLLEADREVLAADSSD